LRLFEDVTPAALIAEHFIAGFDARRIFERVVIECYPRCAHLPPPAFLGNAIRVKQTARVKMNAHMMS